MATVSGDRPAGHARVKTLAADWLEKAIAIGSVLMLAALVIALARGQAAWARIPTIVWLHMATIAVALALTPVILLRKRGTRSHRRFGWAWSIAMAATAALSLFVDGFSNGEFSIIHLLSLLTLVGVFGLVATARTHKVARHRSIVRSLSGGALIIAGVFTLVPGRMLGHFLWG